MGEAKRKLEQVRASFIAELDNWSFPDTEWERRTVAEIRNLPVVKVKRYPDDALEYMRMPPRECHKNARLHSVVDQYGDYVCITPAPLHPENPFDFIPDDKIEWRDEGDFRVAYRDGVEIGPGVRSDAAKAIADLNGIRSRLVSGMNPYEAVRNQR